MAPTNTYFSFKNTSEQNLYEDLVIESLKIYGEDVYYLPRDILEEDRILNEEIESQFNESYMIEMYLENLDGFEGEGTMLQQFGLEVRDQATLIVSRRRWEQLVGYDNNDIEQDRPYEGDLIYIPFSRTLFEIRFVEDEKPFYQLNNLPVYELQCERFEYEQQDFNTGVEELDNMQAQSSNLIWVVMSTSDRSAFPPNAEVEITLPSGTVATSKMISAKETESGDTAFSLASIDYPSGVYEPIEAGSVVNAVDNCESAVIVRVIDRGDDDYPSVTNDPYDSSHEYEKEQDDLLDFSEDNPFGDL